MLCACNSDHSVIKLLEPPADAKVGERVVFQGYAGEPASSSAMAKKKVLEKLAPGVILYSVIFSDTDINIFHILPLFISSI